MNIYKIFTLLFLSQFLTIFNPIQAQSSCVGDTLRPFCIAPPDRTLGCDSLDILYSQIRFSSGIDSLILTQIFGAAESVDNCNSRIVELQPIHNLEAGEVTLIRQFIAIDESGNQSTDTCRQYITTDPTKNLEKIIELPSLYDTLIAFFPTTEFVPMGCNSMILGARRFSLIFNSENNNDSISDYTLLNWYYAQNDPFYLPLFDIDGDGKKGDAYTVRYFHDSLFFQRPGLPDSVIAAPKKTWRYTLNQPYEFSGNVFIDSNQNCKKETEETPLNRFVVSIKTFPSGEIFEIKTDSLGNYYLKEDISFIDTLFEVSLITNLNLGQQCGNSFFVDKSDNQIPIRQDFALNLIENCPKLSVDIGAVRLRRCFDNNRLFINYFNYSSLDIEEVSVDVILDPFLLFENSTITANATENNTYQFPIGFLGAGESGQFSILVTVSCDAEIGQTHCSEAIIFPNEICEPIKSIWSGASIEVAAACEGDSVKLKIENIGDGAMIQDNNFVITEDVLMLRQGNFQLDPQEALTFTYPANGATYRIAANQVANHPGKSQPSISLEGCGGINTIGLVNAFPQDDGNFFEAIDCQENIGSYDPNDKTATPNGWGAENYLDKNTDIEYRIRFQNTGTDTAFKVVIIDTLSTFLDASTIIPGAASHTYTYHQFLDTINEVTVIKFVFDDILLPDSTTNLEGSNGFVKFKIAQQADLLNGTILENKAAIFFDFNEPIITNVAVHTIGEPFNRILASDKEIYQSIRQIKLQPNPFQKQTTLTISGSSIKEAQIVLYDALGKVVLQQDFSGNKVTIFSENLEAGMYFYQVKANQQLVGSGKIILSR